MIKTVGSKALGLEIAKDLLYKYADDKTVLFLSGGTTPKPLYETLAREKKLRLGAGALVDERIGLPDHKNSNEKMIKDTGLLVYFERKKIPFHSILKLQEKRYEEDVRYLMSNFSNKIAIMGIGEDGHTAGLPPGVQSSKFRVQSYVTEIRDFPGEFKKRITLTFDALSKMDLLIVLVFGSAKQNALKLMFEKGSREEIPARFYIKHGITEKTILITDQKV